MWITQALVGPMYLALPGVDGRHASAVFICSALALGMALMNALIPSDPRLAFLYPMGGALALVDVAVLVAKPNDGKSVARHPHLPLGGVQARLPNPPAVTAFPREMG